MDMVPEKAIKIYFMRKFELWLHIFTSVLFVIGLFYLTDLINKHRYSTRLTERTSYVKKEKGSRIITLHISECLH